MKEKMAGRGSTRAPMLKEREGERGGTERKASSGATEVHDVETVIIQWGKTREKRTVPQLSTVRSKGKKGERSLFVIPRGTAQPGEMREGGG